MFRWQEIPSQKAVPVDTVVAIETAVGEVVCSDCTHSSHKFTAKVLLQKKKKKSTMISYAQHRSKKVVDVVYSKSDRFSKCSQNVQKDYWIQTKKAWVSTPICPSPTQTPSASLLRPR